MTPKCCGGAEGVAWRNNVVIEGEKRGEEGRKEKRVGEGGRIRGREEKEEKKMSDTRVCGGLTAGGPKRGALLLLHTLPPPECRHRST